METNVTLVPKIWNFLSGNIKSIVAKFIIIVASKNILTHGSVPNATANYCKSFIRKTYIFIYIYIYIYIFVYICIYII